MCVTDRDYKLAISLCREFVQSDRPCYLYFAIGTVARWTITRARFCDRVTDTGIAVLLYDNDKLPTQLRRVVAAVPHAMNKKFSPSYHDRQEMPCLSQETFVPKSLRPHTVLAILVIRKHHSYIL